MTISYAYFSPGGTTRRYGSALDRALGTRVKDIDLTIKRGRRRTFGANDRLVCAFPVHKGRLPLLPLLDGFAGRNTPVYAVVVYGNRDYEDALVELVDALTARGFVVVGAAAVIGEHTYTPLAGAGRPSNADCAELADHVRTAFAANVPVDGVPGNRPYKEVPPGASFVPVVSPACTRCEDCVADCPVGAIPAAASDTTDPELCIACGRCLRTCPEGARFFAGEAFETVKTRLETHFVTPKANEFF